MKFIFAGTKPAGVGAMLAVGGGKSLPRPRLTLSFAVLVLANLAPITGVVFFGWSLFEILYLYILESAVIGLYNAPKLALVRAPARKRARSIFGLLYTYGVFISVELFLLARLFGGPGDTMLANSRVAEVFKAFTGRTDVVIVALAALFISHGTSFFLNFLGKKEYLKVTLEEQQSAPFRRVFVMHVTLILSIFLLVLFKFGSLTPILVLLVFLKTAFDADAHTREHARFSENAHA